MGREGFIHLDSMNGSVEHASMEYIIRDHDKTLFQQKKEVMEHAAAYLNQKYGDGTIDLQIEDSYFNMKEKIEPHMHLIDSVLSVYEKLDIQPKVVPIRGGTDGARLSYMGLPCPNLAYRGSQLPWSLRVRMHPVHGEMRTGNCRALQAYA